jgi:uncharacterized protein (TIGR02300 family)
MGKNDWGTKRLCPSCGARYYDMKKNPPICPKCGTPFDAELLVKTRRRAKDEESPKKKDTPIASADDIEDIEPIEGEEGEEAVIEDAEELADDMDEMVDVEDEENNGRE